MKRKCLFVTFAILLTLLVGCGMSRKDQLSNEYQNMWGMSKEEADEMAELMDNALKEEAEAIKAQEQEMQEKAAVLDAITLCEPSNEIKNSKFGDDIVQIGDVVVKTDGSMTVGDFNRELQKSFKFTLKNGDGEVTDSSLKDTSPFDTPNASSLAAVDEAGNYICDIKYVNPTDSVLNVFDCIVVEVEANLHSVYSLNCFYPGNICAGTYSGTDKVINSDLYAERISEYPPITAQNAEDEFAKAGAKNITGGGSSGRFYTISSKPIFAFRDKDYYKRTTYSYEINMNTAVVNKFETKNDYYAGDLVVGNISDFSTITDEQRKELEGYCSEYLTDWIHDRADSSVELVGFYLDEDADCVVICKTDRNTFEPLKFDYELHYDGSATINDYLHDCYNDPYNTLDELFENEEMQENSYYSVK